ncbi:hypothetical protein METBIDRAFT_9454 [Metschnikowia bicuspidata var. bicuspidata NRRL YB-4993]|uniref:Transcription initiation factor IIF subunit beta n=1 Tax=Metschnikowia bicuspidata var. bicuspidata NRRL YB-4993 TaxID=869754 RepID=A0A1A0HGM3_9ASCO|nr:hypothetical protein METBIDRAFT_9454 [Metschnikowia bicuspidata var. bicuspidata NRRL YB-4993]OBA23151.1 hypothetical protein METBIDRAFT_9454 [Metschnikowia bicuspidata var. bicuspidata NRRL YB-4993]
MSTASPTKPAAGPAVKPEQPGASGPGIDIKKEDDEEAAAADHALLLDPEDYLEENESLDMNLGRGAQKVWLVKLPRYLADRWTDRANLHGQQLGEVKIRQNPAAAAGRKKLEVKLVLDERERSDEYPLEYNLSILNTQVKNSYVFSEQNLRRFQQERTEMGDMPAAPALPDLEKNGVQKTPGKFFRVQKNGSEDRKYVPFVRTIPKKTSLAGKIVHDCQVVPLRGDSKYSQMLSRRQHIGQEKERPKVTFLTDIPGVVQSQAGPSLTGKSTSVFLKSTTPKSKAEGRAIRMPKKDLLDLLFRLFEEYEYWSMKGLKERTRQPETYLKESLESIANLIKKGPYTSKYNLKPEYKRLRDAERAARLGQVATNEAEDEKDDDDDDMEDII